MIPTRGCSLLGGAIQTVTGATRIRRPVSLTFKISRERLRRFAVPNAARALRDAVLAGEFNGQNATSFLAPTAENLASPLGRHTRSKSVGTNSTLVPRSIGWLAHLNFLHNVLACSGDAAKR